MFPPSSPYAGLSKVFLVLIVIGALAAFAFTNSDLTNFITNNAKAEGIKQEIALQKLKDAIDVQNYRIVEDAKTKAQLEKIDADKATYEKLQEKILETRIQQAALELEMTRLFNYGKISASILFILCFSILMVQFGRRHLILAQASMKQIDSGQNATLRKSQIELARQRERIMRERQIMEASISNVPAFYPNQETSISWEDLRQQFADKKKI
jgi:hypothetical protein